MRVSKVIPLAGVGMEREAEPVKIVEIYASVLVIREMFWFSAEG